MCFFHVLKGLLVNICLFSGENALFVRALHCKSFHRGFYSYKVRLLFLLPLQHFTFLSWVKQLNKAKPLILAKGTLQQL